MHQCRVFSACKISSGVYSPASEAEFHVVPLRGDYGNNTRSSVWLDPVSHSGVLQAELLRVPGDTHAWAKGLVVRGREEESWGESFAASKRSLVESGVLKM